MSALDDFRREKDTFFSHHPQSPLDAAQRPSFAGLRYYPANPALRFELAPEPFPEPAVVELETSTGDIQDFVRWATITFNVEGQAASLTLFRSHEGGYFLPFTDAGRGSETYGAGRYLDPEPLDDGLLLVDFNYAYNPYCAYNDAWSCPIPPRENHVPLHIRAGEMAFHD